MNPRHDERGLTIIEIAISVAVLSGLALVIGSVLDTATGAYRSTSPAAVAQLTHRTAEQVAESVAFAGLGTLEPGPVGSPDGSALSFRACIGSDAGAPQFGPESRVEWVPEPGEPQDGKDNDGDGAVDEGMAVLRLNIGLPGERSVVLAQGVARHLEGETPNGLDDNGNGAVDERGLLLAVEGRAVRIHLTLLRQGKDGHAIARTASCVVALRN